MRSFFFIAALLVGVAFVNVAQANVLVQKQGPVTVHHSARLDIDWCEGCVQLMLVVINEVLNEILNGGVTTDCAALCKAALPNNNEAQELCDVACAVVGIDEFITYLKNNPPNPLYMCQLADQMCPILDCIAPTCMNVTHFAAVPSSGPVGTKFNLNLIYKVLSPAGAGMLRFEIWPGSNKAAAKEHDFLMESYPVGTYPVAIQVDSQKFPTNGVWNARVLLCEGDCSWVKRKGAHTRLLGQAQTSFTLTSN